METKKELAAPCGLYCGACGIYFAHKANNTKLKERLTSVYGVTADEMQCEGCLSDTQIGYCKTCSIKTCTAQKGLEGCYQCGDFPCKFIYDLGGRNSIAMKVMLRAIPAWRQLGTNGWLEEEAKRYHCPHCGHELFRGVRRCRDCGNPVDVD